MFKIDDIVQHKQTGKVGKVVGYGCRLTDDTYFLTLKVKPFEKIAFQPVEDLVSEWRFVRDRLPIVIQSRQNKIAA